MEREGWGYCILHVQSPTIRTNNSSITKLLRPLVKRWRSKGLKVVLYVDNDICMAATKQATSQAVQMIRQDLIRAGRLLTKGG